MHTVNTDIAALDIRALNFLQVLLQTASVTRTGELLGMSQPSASRTLARIRDLIGDPLLIRTQNGYQLTDHATSLQKPILEAINALQAVFQRPEFDPTQANMTFRLACTDYAVACVIGPTMRRLAKVAPGVRMEISPLVPDSFAMLENSEVDFVLYATLKVKGDFIARKLFDEKYAVVLRDEHPLLEQCSERDGLEASDLAAYPQIEFSYPTQEHLRVDPVLRAEIGSTNSVLSVPFFSAMPFLISGTDAVAPVPARFAALLTSMGGVKAVPYRIDSGFPYHLIWHERARHNPATQWLTEQFIRAMK